MAKIICIICKAKRARSRSNHISLKPFGKTGFGYELDGDICSSCATAIGDVIYTRRF